jgi:hypothetical protein
MGTLLRRPYAYKTMMSQKKYSSLNINSSEVDGEVSLAFMCFL